MRALQNRRQSGTRSQAASGQMQGKGNCMPATVPEKKPGFLLKDCGRNPT